MISVLIADDHNIVREGIALILQQEPDIKVIGQAVDGRDAWQKAIKLKPDVVLMDISMPQINGIEASELLMQQGFTGRIVILTQYDKEEYIRMAMQVGVAGYLAKDSIKQEVIDAVRKVAAGEMFLSPSISKLLIGDYMHKSKKAAPVNDFNLTARELQVLQHIAEGQSSRQIADLMFVSIRTVEFHRANIIQKLGIRDVASLTKFAIKQGLVKV